MTIEHLIQTHDNRIALLDGFLRLAHLGRRSRESAVARKVRRNLIVEIEDMMAYDREEIAEFNDYLAEANEADRQALECHMPSLGNEVWEQFTTVFDKIVLLDAAPRIDGRRAFDPAMGRWYRVEVGYPKKVTVDVAQLGALAALIEEMAEALDISFTLERFLWTEDTLGQWVLADQMREGNTSTHSS